METAPQANPEPVPEAQSAADKPVDKPAVGDSPEQDRRMSILAAVSGYAALIPFVAAFYLFPFAYAGFPPSLRGKGIVLTAVISVACVAPALTLAILGHRRIRRNRALGGIGHVRFAYAACAMALGVLLTALALIPMRH